MGKRTVVLVVLLFLAVTSIPAAAETDILPSAQKALPFVTILGLAAASDDAVRDFAQNSQSASGDVFWGNVTHFGHGAVDLGIIGALALAGEEKAASRGFNALITSGLAVQAAKNLVGRPRPYTEESRFKPLSFNPDYASFPSGHTTSAFALATVLSQEYPKYKAIFYTGAALVGLSRVYLDVHYASDVLAGAAVGMYFGSQAQAGPLLQFTF